MKNKKKDYLDNLPEPKVIQLTDSKLRCLWCGNPTEDQSCCSDNCEKQYEQRSEAWEKKGLCVWCGKQVYIDKEGKKYRACYEHLVSLTKVTDNIKSFAKIIKETNKNITIG